jgi:hypothetical protein
MFMQQSRQPRTPFELSKAVNHQLTLYALAASSAGVGLLAIAQPAEAKIVYTKTHHVIGLSHPYKLDLNHDGTTDFVLLETEGGSQGFKQIHLAARVELGNVVEGSSAPNGRGYAFALKAGAPINGRQHFVGARSGEFMAVVEQSDTVFLKYYGNWYNVTARYLGLKLKIGGKTHYGWARLNVDFQGFAISATLTGYAYETIPGKSINAGQTKDAVEDRDEERGASLAAPIPVKPQPATLGVLAMGAHGLSIWRRESAVSTP